MTLIINHSQLKQCIELSSDLIPIIENAFIQLSNGNTTMPPILRLDIKEYHGEADVKTAYIKGLDSFAIKVASGFFNNPSIGLPTSSGLMILLDSKTGLLKAVLLDKGYLTDIRTAIAGSIASKYLSNENSTTVAIIGTGMQARLQLSSLCLVRNITHVNIWGRDESKIDKYIEDMKIFREFKLVKCSSVESAVKESEIIITTTPSNSPLIQNQWLQSGQHITAMGSDAEHKNELYPEIILSCNCYVPDNLDQTRILGELNHAITKKIIDKDKKFTELGEIIKNPSSGRKTENDITVCDLTGTGVQDTAIARYAFDLAKSKNLGMEIN